MRKNVPVIEPQGFRDYDARWRYPEEINLLGGQRIELGLCAFLRELILIARGNGRAYGDSAINAFATIEMHHLNRMTAFDSVPDQLVAKAGVLLGDIIATLLPHGWLPMVTPRTKFVTLGSAIAAGVHGKNRHKDGSFRA